MALNTKPDFMIINRLLSDISGPELTKVFRALDPLSDCRMILLTSDDELGDLPEDVTVVHKGPEFFADLKNQLIDLGLFGDI